MKLGVVLRFLAIASGIGVGTVVAIGRLRWKRPTVAACSLACRTKIQPLKPARRDYFVITKVRASSVPKPWVLQGFGRYECLLFLPSWREAVDQACFRADHLASTELVLATSTR